MKRIVVTQRIAVDPQSGERRDALDQRFASWLAKADMLLFPLPNQWAERSALHAWLVALNPAGLILSGGPDLGVAPERDRTESDVLDWAASERLPVLGICRGMQMLALRAGATLVSLAGHVGGDHEITGARGREAKRLVNSYHRLGLRVCPPDYQALAWAQDGSIEAMRHHSLPWEGWMWHPERESNPRDEDLHRLRELFALSAAAPEPGAGPSSDRP